MAAVAGSVRLDTHVVVWLYAGDVVRISPTGLRLLQSQTPTISPIVQLELTYLHEIGRLTVGGADIVGDLTSRIGLQLSTQPMLSVVQAAASLTWTRHPFDRMIVADAIASNTTLLTKDETIRSNTTIAAW
jgi:PIN domain nuclease of toxin-antitoxin system